MEEYTTVKKLAEEWGLTVRRVQKMCADGQIDGAVKSGRDWKVPEGTERPKDGRLTTGMYRNWRKSKKDKK